MVGKVLNLEEFLEPDHLATEISRKWHEWDNKRATWKREQEEIHKYIYATDTTKTSNVKLPWNNKTTIPKTAQIQDNLHANYLATMFPKRKWLNWEGDSQIDEEKSKREAIEAYMTWALDRSSFKQEVSKLVLDYIRGNAFVTLDWVDETINVEDGGERTKVGYVGPMIKRISPLDIVFNPIAPAFKNSPKIIRSWVSLGEVKEILERESTEEHEREKAQELFRYLRELRDRLTDYSGTINVRDAWFNIEGFDDFRGYLDNDYAEVLTFYGDIYDKEKDVFLRNHVITIVDRHKIIAKHPNPTFFGTPPIWHAGWRVRQDNLWAMGALDNLIGMQYRIDHLENLKADVFDLIAFPPLKIRGYVEDFTWGPFARIFVGDEGDVEVLSPQVQALQANFEIAQLEQKMEEMAGAPKEALGFRTPGEKTAFEVQRLENAASRIFQSKITQFEQQIIEPVLNGMLELARRKLTNQTIRTFDNEFKISTFTNLTAEDITGNGRIRPKAAQHFAERTNQIQNLTAFFGSAIGADPEIKAHMSSVELARLFEELLEIENHDIVEPYVRLSEQADAQRIINAQQEQVLVEAQTPSGLSQDDFDEDLIVLPEG